MVKNIMEHKGYKAQIMEAVRLEGDVVHALPPGKPLDVYSLDMFMHPPENWVKGAGSFVVPVRPGYGLWFNFRHNSEINTAVVLTLKGVNPVTGMQTSGFNLEKYETKCPKHGCDFLSDRYCPDCNYKWPDRSYLSSSPLWWDGWLNQKDGTVRQFFFTEDELRDVASSLIGKENTVPAFGFAFYSPKELRQELVESYRIYHTNVQTTFHPDAFYTTNCGPISDDIPPSFMSQPYAEYGCSVPIPCSVSASSASILGSASPGICRSVSMGGGVQGSYGPRGALGEAGNSRKFLKTKTPTHVRPDVRRESAPVKEVSIGAGAKIDQRLNADPFALGSWKDTPDSVMTIYFVFQDKLEELKSKGIRDLEGSKEGMLTGCVVG